MHVRQQNDAPPAKDTVIGRIRSSTKTARALQHKDTPKRCRNVVAKDTADLKRNFIRYLEPYRTPLQLLAKKQEIRASFYRIASMESEILLQRAKISQ
ncbi:hypothetical protein BSK49_00775 [Paenibacillus odorifer]|nr:hypothetical protein BSK49_00775 [Paenibacillus odorifer]